MRSIFAVMAKRANKKTELDGAKKDISWNEISSGKGKKA